MSMLHRFRSRSPAFLLLIVIFFVFVLHPDRFFRRLFLVPAAKHSEDRPKTDTETHFTPFDHKILHWDQASVPETKIQAHAPGSTIFDRLYSMEGIIYIVTSTPELIPPPKEITSKGQKIDGSVKQLEPTEEDLRIITPDQASKIFGRSATRITGVTFLVNESSQYLNHFYHFAAEVIFGLWRTYSHLDPTIQPNGATKLPSPRRMVFPHISYAQWRDYAALNQYIIRAVFPSLTLEFEDAWAERAALRTRVFVYDRVVFSDRIAAMHGDKHRHNSKPVAEAFNLEASSYWWSTIRMAVLEYAKVRRTDIPDNENVITYVSRQRWGRRMLKQDDHLRLVAGLEKLRENHGYEVNVVEWDKMTRSEQIRLAARTTIMIGLHGNGLTHLIWMKPTVKSTVIEFFCPGGYAHDYNFPSQMLGIAHFGVQNDHVITAPNLPKTAFPEGFQGNQIPLDADTVIRLIQRRMTAADLDADD